MQEVAATISPFSTGLDASEHSLEELFPKVDPQFEPYGHRVLVQLRRTVSRSKGGILLARDTKDTEAWNIQVAKVLALGPLAFRNRATGESWPEGQWAQIRDYVKVPRWGGDRWSVDLPEGDPVVVVVFADSDLIGKFLGDPRNVKAFIA